MKRREGPQALRLAPLVLAAVVSSLSACLTPAAPESPPASERPYALLLGTAQDAGLPQLGCREDCCEVARRDPRRARRVTSLLVVDPRSGGRWLFDASPDLGAQVELTEALAGPGAADDPERPGRPPLFDGIFLTHAHMGHYAGLLQLGREAYGVRGQRVHASTRMGAFLTDNDPWSLLVASGGIELETLQPADPGLGLASLLRDGPRLHLTDELTVQSLHVPHREEFSDTLAFLIAGPDQRLLYLPDIDKWERWDVPLEDLLEHVDVALLDATFFGPAELPGRDMASIPHPFIVETLARLEARAPHLLERVVFTHLNHSNPAADPASDAARRVRAAGASVARELQRFDL